MTYNPPSDITNARAATAWKIITVLSLISTLPATLFIFFFFYFVSHIIFEGERA